MTDYRELIFVLSSGTMIAIWFAVLSGVKIENGLVAIFMIALVGFILTYKDRKHVKNPEVKKAISSENASNEQEKANR